MRYISLAVVISMIGLAPTISLSQSSQSQFEQNQRNAQEVYERQQKQKQKEELRDKSHDFPRIKTGKDTSVGVDPTKPNVNVKRTY